MVCVKSRMFQAFLRLFVSSILVIMPLMAKAQRAVCQIEIHSTWGGLGEPQDEVITIKAHKGSFVRDGEKVDPKLIQALVAALQAPSIPKPEMDNLGITPQWLKANLVQLKRQMPWYFKRSTKSQQKLFHDSYIDPVAIAKIMPSQFIFASLDDYPHVKVEITYEDGEHIVAESWSYYAFMIPWRLNGDKENGDKETENYDASISRAVSALLPPNTVNRERLAGSGFARELADSLMRELEPQSNLLEVKAKASSALDELRKKYSVKSI